MGFGNADALPQLEHTAGQVALSAFYFEQDETIVKAITVSSKCGGLAMTIIRLSTTANQSVPMYGTVEKAEPHLGGLTVARRRTLTAAALNIEMAAPHDSQRYLSLFRNLFDLRQPIQVFGDMYLIFSGIDKVESSFSLENGNFKEYPVISGSLARFTTINFDVPWFDEESFEAAEKSLVRQIRIPSNIHPNYRKFLFRFDSQQHLLVFEQAGPNINISPKQVEKFFRILTDQDQITKEFGFVNVTMLQSEETVDSLLTLPVIKWLRIEYRRPNEDDHDRFERIMEEKMSGAGARAVVLELEGDPRRGALVDAELETFARSAIRHGSVEANGRDKQGSAVRLSSDERPLVKRTRYDPADLDDRGALDRAAQAFKATKPGGQ